MGTLSLEILEARALGGERDAAAPAGVAALSVVAHWRLSYPEEPGRRPAEGSTLLVLQKSAGGWQIVQDASM
jgi:ketosteroid isomerase-like protein